jgi:hypothetical protein
LHSDIFAEPVGEDDPTLEPIQISSGRARVPQKPGWASGWISGQSRNTEFHKAEAVRRLDPSGEQGKLNISEEFPHLDRQIVAVAPLGAGE